MATQPFRVMRVRPRSVFARNPRSRNRSTTAEGGRRFLKNAKSLKKLRSPGCKSRSTQERINGRPDNSAPAITKSLAERLSPKLLTGNKYVGYLTICQKVPSIARVAIHF